MLPLHGIRVLDLSSVVFGPYAAQWLADLGADVIKIEPPEGDNTRLTGPANEPGMAALFLGVNRSKRSVVLDLTTPVGRHALGRLIDGADVLLHSIRPQKLARLGLDPTEVCARNPRLVYAGLHGFTASGPYGGRPAYDDVIQGMAGNADLMARSTGEPRYFPTIAADKTSGLVGATAILAALVRRSVTGKGGFVEVPMFETQVAFNLVEHMYGAHFEPPRGSMGYPRILAEWRRPFATADGWLCMMPYTNAHWRAFFTEAGAPELADDPRFTDYTVRAINVAALYALAGGFVAKWTSADLLATLERLQVPCAPVFTLEQLPHNPHLVATGFFTTLDDPAVVPTGTLTFPGVPVQFDGERPGMRFPPRLGEHTREVLTEAGLSAAEIDVLST